MTTRPQRTHARRVIIGAPAGSSVIASHFRALGEELVRRGNDVVLLVDKQRKEVDNGESGLRIISWPSPRPTRLKDAMFAWSLLREFRPQCVVANFGAVTLLVGVAALVGVPVRVAWYHTVSTAITAEWTATRLRWRLQRLRRRFIYRLSTQVVANSDAAAEDAGEAFGVPEAKRVVFPNSIPDPMPGLGDLPSREPGLLVCVGRLDLAKGQDVLVEAAARLQADIDGLRLVFLGDGSMRGELEGLAERLGVGPKCRFLGHLPRQDVLRWMARAQATIVPSRAEAFGLVNLESMAVGTPVVASRVGGIPEVVEDAVTGFLVDAGNPSALGERVGRLLRAEDLASQLGSAARRAFVSRFERTTAIHMQADWIEGTIEDQADETRGL